MYAWHNAGTLTEEAVFQKVIKILNETVGVVLEYLKDAKVLYISDNIKLLWSVFMCRKCFSC